MKDRQDDDGRNGLQDHEIARPAAIVGSVPHDPVVAVGGLRERVVEDVQRALRFVGHSATRGCTRHPPRDQRDSGGQEDQVKHGPPEDERQFVPLEVR